MRSAHRNAVGIVGALVMLGTGVCHSATYFVSRTGDDAAAGVSERAALASIGKGVSVLKPGDTLIVLPGTYFEAVSARLAGRPGAPITIRAKLPGTVLMRGDVDLTGFQKSPDSRHTYWVAFRQRVEGLAERSSLRIYEPVLSRREVERTLATFYQDPGTGRLYVHTTDSGHPDRHVLCASVTDGFGILITPPPHEKTAHDLVIDGLSFTGYQSRDFPKGPGSRSRWGLHIVSGERVVVRRCTAFLNSGGIYLLASRDSVVEDCYAFGNFSRFLDLGNNILGWSVDNTTFRRNRVRAFWHGSGASDHDITFYGGGKGLRGVMTDNLAIDAGLMIKGRYGPDTVQRGNIVVGRRGYFYRQPDPSNLLIRQYDSHRAQATYADPVQFDFRLQSDAPVRGKGADGGDPGPFPYRDEVFFVSPAGDDAEVGASVSKAWRTLARAARSVKPGDTVYVMAGVYAESLIPGSSGTPGSPIRFRRRGMDRVVLTGEGRLPVGIDLSGREHVQVNGFTIRDFVRHGILARDGDELQIEECIIAGTGGDAVDVSGVRGLRFCKNLVCDSRAGGLRVAKSPDATVIGNIFGATTAGPRVRYDAETLQSLWSDRNAYEPAREDGAALIATDGRTFATLKAWQAAVHLDPASLAVQPGYAAGEGASAYAALRPDSPLIGRGQHAGVIGPYRRHVVQAPLPIEDVAAHSVTATTATVEWWTPTERVSTALEWGATPACKHVAPSPNAIFHSVGVIGLTPGTRYFFRVATSDSDKAFRFAASTAGGRPAPAAGARRSGSPRSITSMWRGSTSGISGMSRTRATRSASLTARATWCAGASTTGGRRAATSATSSEPRAQKGWSSRTAS